MKKLFEISFVHQKLNLIKWKSFILEENQTKKNQFQQSGITVAGGNGYGWELIYLPHPFGIFIDNDKSIYIGDSLNHRIVKWKLNSNTGQIIAGGDRFGNQKNQLTGPKDIVFDKENNSFIISDHGNKRVIRCFDKNQTDQQIIISNISCWGLTIDKNGFMYVCDQENHVVRRLKQENHKGELVAGGNGQGNHLNQLNYPNCRNHRIMKWKKGAKEGIIFAGGHGEGNSLKQLSYPAGVVVDDLGQIYVADMGNNRVMCWCEGDGEGKIVVGGNQLNRPMGLSFDNAGNLYVVDLGNSRIRKYEKVLI
ncbi:unnamed protein product [Adineta steineri]|uniref:NHL repeat containing protein n=1 Tax=Adineta steineri TaxID=433720 RepID=A0A818VMJ0_9BILA|nr:unnamed protein product [Adineta steineri]